MGVLKVRTHHAAIALSLCLGIAACAQQTGSHTVADSGLFVNETTSNVEREKQAAKVCYEQSLAKLEQSADICAAAINEAQSTTPAGQQAMEICKSVAKSAFEARLSKCLEETSAF
ncbi:MAG TPA: hypothetical protein PKV67_11935 [Hyphomonas sp.]|nr:hypothetical protein [Hyphomonas sp.]HRK68075.1 hypothetical protein [Hyphomonas sp.]